jgi:tetratricopeptide (TPR) repeat protein
MLKRLMGWMRTSTRFWLLILAYFWIGAAYKLIYAQSHDTARFKLKLPLPYYQQQFLIDSLLQQTWMFGPDFQDYLGRLPSLATLLTPNGANPVATLADYCRQRENELQAFPARHPRSPFSDTALDSAYRYSQVASVLGILGAREQPRRVLARPGPGPDGWRSIGLADFSRQAGLSQRLADEYPDSPYAPAALLRLAGLEIDQGRVERGRALYERVAREYPRSEEAEEAANALYAVARAASRVEEMREFRMRALHAAEQLGRERNTSRILPATTSVAVLGYRVDLSSLELQLERLEEALGLFQMAEREAGRLKAMPDLEDRLKGEVTGARKRLSRVGDELWVRRELFEKLGVPPPGIPPRPQEFTVRGRVEVQGSVAAARGAGVEVALTQKDLRIRSLPELVGVLRELPYRAEVGPDGRYEIPAVPSGEYTPVVLYDARPTADTAVVPHPDSAFPGRVRMEQGDLELPPFRFRPAISTRSFGELGASGAAVRLEWDPWPRAASYTVEVLAPPEWFGMFRSRFRPSGGAGKGPAAGKLDPGELRRRFRRRPVLWRQEALKTAAADCPLQQLYPDQPAAAAVLSYEYVVRAHDANGAVLAESARPLCRFILSQEARGKMLQGPRPVRPQQAPTRPKASGGVAWIRSRHDHA